MDHKKNFLCGMRDGIPIALGYLAVSFTLGIACRNIGMSAFDATVMSLTNLTSAGEFAALGIMVAGAGYWEMALSQFVINLRYMLMSASLSQKLAPDTPLYHRLLVGYGVTDEIFGISSTFDGKLSPYYTYGAIAVAAPAWVLGTLLGALLGNILPASATSALGVALYAMFLAIILPPARKSRVIAVLVAISMAASLLLTLACDAFGWTGFTEGFRIIVLTVAISLGAAILFPVREGTDEEVSDV